jgi:branched-subunit amino acid transport protein AzlD
MTAFLTVAVVALVTAALRLLPVLLLGKGERAISPLVAFLGRVMPSAMIGLLVVYSLKNVDPIVFPHGLPELAGVLTAAGLQAWRKNTLFSIFCATAVYMALIRIL